MVSRSEEIKMLEVKAPTTIIINLSDALVLKTKCKPNGLIKPRY